MNRWNCLKVVGAATLLSGTVPCVPVTAGPDPAATGLWPGSVAMVGDRSCPWDCQESPNGSVDVVDFLALLSQWGQVGTSCDFNGGGVDVADFLTLLANWGPCP